MSEDLLKQIMKEIMLVEMKFTMHGDASFTVYARLEDAEKMVDYIKKLVQGITTKVKENLEKTNMIVPKEIWDKWNEFWEHTPAQIKDLNQRMGISDKDGKTQWNNKRNSA